MPSVRLSHPLPPGYAEHLGLATRTYEVGETIVLDIELSQFLEVVGYGVVLGDPEAGAPLLFGTGAPAAGLGANGSYYLDTAAEVVYGPKVGGAWGTGTPLAQSNVLLGGLAILPAGPPGPPGPPGQPGDSAAATNVSLRAATDYDNTTAPTSGAVIAWNGTKFAPKIIGATDVGAVALTGAQTIAGVKTFSSAPVIPAPAAAGNPVRHDDSRLTNARTPTSHAGSHASNGADPVTPTAIGASPATHGHTAAGVGAAPVDHTHVITDIVIAGTPDGSKFLRDDGTWASPSTGAITSGSITDATAVGRAVLTAVDAAAARSAISAVLGTGITEARKITQVAYDALATKDAATLYVIQG